MTTTTAVSGSTSATTSTGAAGTKADLSEDRFLKLLVAQLANQDPMNPQSEDFMQQVAALGTVESLKARWFDNPGE